MTAFHFYHPTSHGFRGMLLCSRLIVGAVTGMKVGFPSVAWVVYSYGASFLFGIVGIQPFASHDVPPPVVAAFYSLYAAPSGLAGSVLGATLKVVRRRRNKTLADKASHATSEPAPNAVSSAHEG
jgi:hypothetical protein